MIRDGVDPELDDLRHISRSGKQLIAAMEERERARTGIASLKVRYNRVFGYYIEVSKSNLPAVPADYRQPAGSRILGSRTRRGTEIYLPLARNPGMAASLTVFTLIWAAAIWATIAFDAPLIFPIIFGGFGALLVFLVIDQWVGVGRVTADRDGVTIAKGWLVARRERTLLNGSYDST